MTIKILQGDCRDKLKELAAGSVHCIVTSPPYYGLRDYNVAGQLGLEATPDEYIATMVQVFREVKRVLRPDGCCFVNLGDSYCSGTSNVRYVLREDCTLTELQSVALEVLGVRVTGDEEAGQRVVPQVLRDGIQGQAICSEPSLARRREQDQLSAASFGSYRENDRADQADEDRCDNGAGRQVRVLWGDDTAVPDAGSHPRGRSSASEAADGQEPSIVDQDISRGAPARLSEGPVSRPLLQLQLRDRIMGLLSSRQFTSDEIPTSVRACFKASGLKPKDLLGMPWRLALALQADGWWLRSDIIWHKPGPMPESVRDRPVSAHEHVFLLTKQPKYFFDLEAIREPSGAAPRNVWTIASHPFPLAHFATFSPALAERCIKAGTSERGCCAQCGTPWVRQVDRDLERGQRGAMSTEDYRIVTTGWAPGCSCCFLCGEHDASKGHALTPYPAVPCRVLDPFAGAGTTGLVADRLQRDAVLIELSPAYCAMLRNRITSDAPLFAEVTDAPA